MKLNAKKIAEIRQQKSRSQYSNLITAAQTEAAASTFFRVVDLDERGIYKAHVEDQDGKSIFDYSNEDESGETGPLSLVEDGFMKHVDDLSGLEKYLKGHKIMPENSQLVDSNKRDQFPAQEEEELSWDEATVKAELLKHFGEEAAEDIEDSLEMDKGPYSSHGASATVTVDGTEYTIISSYEEADRIAEAIVKDDLDSDPSMFNQEWLQHYLEVTDTDRRLFSNEEADALVENMQDDELVEKADMLEAFEAAEEAEDDAAQEEIIKQAKEAVQNIEADRIHEALADPVQYFVHDSGIYTMEDLVKSNIVRIDTSKAAEDAVSADGWAHFLSRYSGSYDQLENGMVIFREN